MLRSSSDLVPVPGQGALALIIGRVLDTPVPWTKHVHKQLAKGIGYGEIGDKFGVGASIACEKVNTAGTGENLFRLGTVSGHRARVPTKGYVLTGACRMCNQLTPTLPLLYHDGGGRVAFSS